MNRCAKAVVGAVLLAAAGVGLVSCGKPPGETRGANSTQATTNSTAAETPAAFKKLVGQWERPDGGYVLEVKSIDASGQLEAAYMNPSPIHVSKAIALRDGDEVKVFVELRDVNYPGCTYSLKYDAKFDQLYGEYFQAAMGQRFDVTFARLKTDPAQ